MEAAPEHFNNLDYTYPSFPVISKNYIISQDILSSPSSYNERGFKYKFSLVIGITILVISILGAVGNGIVIWLLSFRIKRNPFSTYILNLAVADLGVLLSFLLHSSIICLYELGYINIDIIIIYSAVQLFLILYSTGQFFLTAISIDRFVAVFFPLWHQCHRPRHLSTSVCTLIWLLSVLSAATTFTLLFYTPYDIRTAVFSQSIVNVVFCLPVMTTTTVALFIKVCLKARQHRRGKLLTIILLSLLVFLLFAFPLNVAFILYFFNSLPPVVSNIAMVLACLNSSINPVIYFLVGRHGESRRQESMKMILQKVFKEEDGYTEETPVETQS